MKEQNRQRIQQCLEQLDAWRASGLSMKAFAQQHGHDINHCRAWLSWESRWRNLLERHSASGTGNASTTTFVKASPRKAHASAGLANIAITLRGHSSTISANITWPVQSSSACAAWLREVLA